MEKELEFKAGQVWGSDDREEVFFLAKHEECGLERLRRVFLRICGKPTFEVGLPLDDFDRKYYAGHSYYCLAPNLRTYFRKFKRLK